MGNTDSIPVVSQLKSLVQVTFGDAAGALETQENFAYRNTFPVVSQIASAGYAIGGEPEKAKDLQVKFADDMQGVIDSIPVLGHIKGGVHYAIGQDEQGEQSLKAASRSTGVLIGGIAGGIVGGPPGALAGGITGGAAADVVISGSDVLAKGDEAKPHGYVAIVGEIEEAVQGRKKISVGRGFDMTLLPVSDGLGGQASGSLTSKANKGSKSLTASQRINSDLIPLLPVRGAGSRGIRPLQEESLIGSRVITTRINKGNLVSTTPLRPGFVVAAIEPLEFETKVEEVGVEEAEEEKVDEDAEYIC